MRNCTIRVAKTKVLISFAVTAKLICAFVFASADYWFSHVAAHTCNFQFDVTDVTSITSEVTAITKEQQYVYLTEDTFI